MQSGVHYSCFILQHQRDEQKKRRKRSRRLALGSIVDCCNTLHCIRAQKHWIVDRKSCAETLRQAQTGHFFMSGRRQHFFFLGAREVLVRQVRQVRAFLNFSGQCTALERLCTTKRSVRAATGWGNINLKHKHKCFVRRIAFPAEPSTFSAHRCFLLFRSCFSC